MSVMLHCIILYTRRIRYSDIGRRDGGLEQEGYVWPHSRAGIKAKRSVYYIMWFTARSRAFRMNKNNSFFCSPFSFYPRIVKFQVTLCFVCIGVWICGLPETRETIKLLRSAKHWPGKYVGILSLPLYGFLSFIVIFARFPIVILTSKKKHIF